MSENGFSRRPIASRSTAWAQAAAALIARTPITPNQISLLSIVFAAIGAGALLICPGWLGLLTCAICIQLRLLCNLFDGMVAVEHEKGSPVGSLYNEVPDRVADSLLIVALGYAIAMPWLGWLGALLAMMTAYVRVLGGALGQVQDFRGPMAKAHRMATMTAACLLAMLELYFMNSRYVLYIAAVAIVLGTAWTCAVRLQVVAKRCREHAEE